MERDSNAGDFLWDLQNFKERLVWRTSANDCFWMLHKHIMNAQFSLSTQGSLGYFLISVMEAFSKDS